MSAMPQRDLLDLSDRRTLCLDCFLMFASRVWLVGRPVPARRLLTLGSVVYPSIPSSRVGIAIVAYSSPASRAWMRSFSRIDASTSRALGSGV